ncbi:MAG: hypothetical protein B7Z75_05265 [Acidocella sp. 20-57-95]|nr:MAG: hypothetical protein B7Z75_05265 [Acidocella sp. 20-57-95]OYV59759.1 MAG: hypothetical protein B7Z71_07415 [Acidocella sp. 21-58-7]HQT64646.1 YciI family protein [Acidocella sp.]HQU05230.1 YciI family protein [Acidocella sp.]
MPLFAVHALDHPDHLPRRLQHYAEHRSFVETANALGVNVVMSGPLQSDDGGVMIGSLFLIEAENSAQVRQFIEADPFSVNKVWDQVSVTRFHRRRG